LVMQSTLANMICLFPFEIAPGRTIDSDTATDEEILLILNEISRHPEKKPTPKLIL